MRSRNSSKNSGTTVCVGPETWRQGVRMAVVAMASVALMLGQPGSASPKSGAERDADRVYEWAKEHLAIIIPGASFAPCEKSEFPVKCEENRENLIETLRVFSRLTNMHYGYKPCVQRGDFIKFFQIEFLDVLYCFRENCNFGIKFTDTSSTEAFGIWVSLGRYLQCRYNVYKAFRNTNSYGIVPNFNDSYKIDLEMRKMCLGVGFPQHLLPYINEAYIIRENTKF